MSFLWWVPELLRELRWWSSSGSSCPWGALGLVLVISASCCFCLGAICGAIAFSAGCRRTALSVLRVVITEFLPQRHPQLDFRGRLAEHRQGGL